MSMGDMSMDGGDDVSMESDAPAPEEPTPEQPNIKK